ncbi:MAG: hypothetical protein ACYS21_14945 [Planctomycetota bacterium]|jgi:predicted transcriptional regulator
MKRETFLKHLRAVVLRYKKRRTVDEIAETLGYKPLTVRKVLNSKPMKPYKMRLTNGFIEKARGYFAEMVAEMESGQYTKKTFPEVPKADPEMWGYQPPRRQQS